MDLLEKAEKHSRKLKKVFCSAYGNCDTSCPYFTDVAPQGTCVIDRNLSDLRRDWICSE